MKKLFLIVFILISVQSFSQLVQYPTNYGVIYRRGGADTILQVPSDTFTVPASLISKSHIAIKNGTLYRWNGSAWVGLSGGSTDTTSLSNRINLKLNISDTTNKWITHFYRKTGSDSVFYVKGGVHTFAFKDSVGSSGGGSGSQNLQQVTDIGDSTTHGLTVSNDSLLPQNSGLAQASGYVSIGTGSADLGNLSTLYMLFTSQNTRIRQTGTVSQIKMYFHSKPASLTAFYFDVWRKNGSNYDSICHIDILSLITAGTTNTITLPRTVNVLEGDFIGLSHTASSGPANFMKAVSETAGGYYKLSTPTWTGMNWAGESVLGGYVPCYVYMEPPHIVSIGNSIMAGYTDFEGWVSGGKSNNWIYNISYKVGQAFSAKEQNMAIGGQTTTQILARFHDDVIALRPRYAILEGGVNDIGMTAASTTTIISNWTAMLDSCVNNGIIPFVNLIYPWTNGTNAQNRQVDTVNFKLDSLCAASYPTAVVIDARSTIGQFRTGGDAGNLWDIKAMYDVDGVHLNAAANTAIAALYTIPSGYTSYNKDNITHNYNVYQFPGQSGTLATLTDFNGYLKGLTANATSVGGGTDKRILFDDNGILGESAGLNFSKSTYSLGLGRTPTYIGLDIYNGITSANTFGINVENSDANGDAVVKVKNNSTGTLWMRSDGTSKSTANTGNIFTSGSLTEMRFITNADANTGGTAKVNFIIGGSLETETFTVDRYKVGVNNASPNSVLQVSGSFATAYVAKAVDYTATVSDCVIEVTATGKTITLPTAASITGRQYTIKLTASGSATVGTTSSQTIDGSTTYSLASQYKYVTVQSNGSNWIIIANN